MSDDEIKGRHDYGGPTVRPTSTPPKAKVWQAAGPVLTGIAVLIVTLIGTITGHLSDKFLEQVIGWVFLASVAAATPRGVLDAIKAMVERER